MTARLGSKRMHRKRATVALNTGDRCARCGTTNRLTLDHIVPKSRGGKNDLANLQLLCRRCNGSKSSKSPVLWQSRTRVWEGQPAVAEAFLRAKCDLRG